MNTPTPAHITMGPNPHAPPLRFGSSSPSPSSVPTSFTTSVSSEIDNAAGLPSSLGSPAFWGDMDGMPSVVDWETEVLGFQADPLAVPAAVGKEELKAVENKIKDVKKRGGGGRKKAAAGGEGGEEADSGEKLEKKPRKPRAPAKKKGTTEAEKPNERKDADVVQEEAEKKRKREGSIDIDVGDAESDTVAEDESAKKQKKSPVTPPNTHPKKQRAKAAPGAEKPKRTPKPKAPPKKKPTAAIANGDDGDEAGSKGGAGGAGTKFSAITRKEIEFIFDRVSETFSKEWAGIIKESNEKYGAQRLSTNMMKHWKTVLRKNVLDKYSD